MLLAYKQIKLVEKQRVCGASR